MVIVRPHKVVSNTCDSAFDCAQFPKGKYASGPCSTCFWKCAKDYTLTEKVKTIKI